MSPTRGRLALLCALAGLGLALACARAESPPPPSPALAAPSPSGSPRASAPRPIPEAVRQAVRAAARDFPGRAGIVYYDLVAHQGVYVGERQVFEAASLVKLPLLVELFRRAEAGELDLSEEMVFEERFRVGGSGRLKDEPAGSRWPLRELARRMIAESDNAATDMLLERLGPSSMEGAMRRLGLPDTTVQRRIFDFDAIDRGLDNRTSPADVARLLRGLAEGALPGAAAMRDILAGQRRRDMLPAGLPPGTLVAHKTGELQGVLHDAGIVEAPTGAYILVLMGQGVADRDRAVAAWASASRAVWNARGRGARKS